MARLEPTVADIWDELSYTQRLGTADPTRSVADQYLALAGQFIVPIIGAYVLTQAAGWVADLHQGRVELLLTAPLTWPRLVADRLLAALAGAATITGTALAALAAAAAGVGADLDPIGLLRLAGVTVLLAAALAAVAALAVAWLRTGAAITVLAVYVAASYLLAYLVPLMAWPDWITRATVFGAYGNPYLETPAWTGLCLLAAVSAALIPVQVAVFLAWPPPLDGTAADWFALLRAHRLAGLIDLDLLLVADNVLLVPMLIAFYLLLHRTRPSAMLLAAAAGATSVLLYVTTNPAVAVAGLADRHAEATTEAGRTTALTAAEGALATWQGTAFHTGYLLGSLAGITIGAVMLRSAVFSRITGYLAIGANAVGLGLYLPGIGVYISVFSVLFLEIWYVLVARRLLTLARPVTSSAAAPGTAARYCP
jgi:hypothetical protein